MTAKEEYNIVKLQVQFSKDTDFEENIQMSIQIEEVMKNFGWGCKEREINSNRITLDLIQLPQVLGLPQLPKK